MQSDLPHTLYNNSKGGNTPSQEDYDEAARLNELSLKRALEKRKKRQQEEGYLLNEVFNGEADK